MAKEYEKRISVVDPDSVIGWLNANFSYMGAVTQEDHYYEPSAAPFVDQSAVIGKMAKTWLRIRRSAPECQVTLKSPNYGDDGEYLYSEEFSVRIDSFDNFDVILSRVGFRKLVTVTKRRSLWRSADIEIAYDRIAGLGSFFEIEVMDERARNHKDPGHIIRDFLKNFPFCWSEAGGAYPELLLAKVFNNCP